MLGRIIRAFTACVIAVAPALACSCIVNVTGCEIPPADVIALARVVSIERNLTIPDSHAEPGSQLHRSNRRSVGRSAPRAQDRPWETVTVTLDVIEHFRGQRPHPLVIRTDVRNCGFPFHEGKNYLVFATEFQGTLIVDGCSATQPAKAAAARIRQLRAFRDKTALPSLFGSVVTQQPLRKNNQNPEEYIEPAAKLTVVAQSGDREYRTETTDSGLYEFTDLPRGEYFVHVEPPPGRIVLWSGGVERVRTPAGLAPSCALNFQVFRAGRLSGTVTTRSGQPASGTVIAEYLGADESHPVRIAASVNAGRFELSRLSPGRYRL